VLRAHLFQNIRGGRPHLRLAPARRRLQIQFVEENFRQLGGRVHVELRLPQHPYLLLDSAHFLFHRVGHFLERLGVNAYSHALHFGQHPRERHIDFLVDLQQFLRFDLLTQCWRQSLQIICPFSRPAAHRHVELAKN